MSAAPDQQPARRERERRQIVAGALRDQEVRARRRPPRRARAACRADRTTRPRCRRRARGRRSRRRSPHSTSARRRPARAHPRASRRACTGARYWMSSATATGIRCIAEKKKSWQPSTGSEPEAEDAAASGGAGSRAGAGSRGTAPATRMSPATPMRTSRAAPSDQPASSSGLMNGPLDENASADATAMTSPDGAHRARRARDPDRPGADAVEVVMAASVCQE